MFESLTEKLQGVFSRLRGKGKLSLTGQLGEVMKESATAALSFARAHALALGLRDEFYAGREIHIHVPSSLRPTNV